MANVVQCNACGKIATSMSEIKIQVTTTDPTLDTQRFLVENAYRGHACGKDCAPAAIAKILEKETFTER